MQNQGGAVSRRLDDPDFQAVVVRRSLGVAMAAVALCAVFAAHDAYVWLNPPKPVFFRIERGTPPVPLVPLDSPVVDDDDLRAWTVKAVLAPYNVNYHDFGEQLDAAGRRFLPEAWNDWAKQFIKHGNLDALKRERLLCYAQPGKAAIIRATKVIGGRLAYDVQFPAVQTCQNTRQENTFKLMMTALVVRVDVDAQYQHGLAVAQLVADRL